MIVLETMKLWRKQPTNLHRHSDNNNIPYEIGYVCFETTKSISKWSVVGTVDSDALWPDQDALV